MPQPHLDSLEDHINECQKTLLTHTINSHLEDIRDAFTVPQDVIKALNAILKSEVSDKDEMELFSMAEIWPTLQDIRTILAHPFPQNRPRGDEHIINSGMISDLERAGRTQTEIDNVIETGCIDGKVYYPIFNDLGIKSRASEDQGILGLSSKNIPNTPPITKEAVVKVIHDLITQELLNQEQLLSDPIPIIITRVLNQVLSDHTQEDIKNYIEYIQNYGFLNIRQKKYCLERAIFEKPNVFLETMDRFLNNPTENNAVKSEKFPFACLLKTINDLCFNGTVLLNLAGRSESAWDFYFHKKNLNVEAVQTALQSILQASGFNVNDFSILPCVNKKPSKTWHGIIQPTIPDYIRRLQTDKTPTLLRKENQAFLCMLYNLNQIDPHLDALMGYIRLNPRTFSLHEDKSYNLFNHYFIYGERSYISTDPYDSFCGLFKIGAIVFSDMCILAQIDSEAYAALLRNANLLAPLIKEKWLPVKNLIHFARQNIENAQYITGYLKNAKKLTQLKEAGIACQWLIQGKPLHYSYFDDVLVSLKMKEYFLSFSSHPKIDMYLFYPDLLDFGHITEKNEHYFSLLCLKSPIFRLMIRHYAQLCALLDMGFNFQALFDTAQNQYSCTMKALFCEIQSVQTLLSCPSIKPEDILKANFDKASLQRVKDIIYLLNHQIPLYDFSNWPNMMTHVLLEHCETLVQLKNEGINLKQLAYLNENFPKHTLLILENPNDYYAQWWINQQKNSHLSTSCNLDVHLTGKYHIALGLEDCIISQISRDSALFLPKFQENVLTIPLPNETTENTCRLYIIHPGVIELLRFLHARNIKISFFDIDDSAHKQNIVKSLLLRAFDTKTYEEMAASSNLLMSHEEVANEITKYPKPSDTEREAYNKIIFINHDLSKYVPQKRITNYLNIKPADDENFVIVEIGENVNFQILQGINHVFYMTGLLNIAIDLAEKNNESLEMSLTRLQVNPPRLGDKLFRYDDLFGLQIFYAEGLACLKTINPNIQEARPGQIFSKAYTLNPNEDVAKPVVYAFPNQNTNEQTSIRKGTKHARDLLPHNECCIKKQHIKR